ncbi:MAG: glutamate synthase [Anaerolineales bacterium]|nr:glutamate synthase [Anaerolineales bacterium]
MDVSPGVILDEHDACAIVASIRITGESTHGNLKRTLEALAKMGHRSGDVQGEGDGCGVLTDIPRQLWAEALEQAGRPAWLSEDRRFFVGHLMVPENERQRAPEWRARTLQLTADIGADLLLDQDGNTRAEALGRMARAQEPLFWQIAGMMSHCALGEVEDRLFELMLTIERETPLHVASLSSHSVVYKVRGSVETLYHYYPELRSRAYTSAITIGHARYSTNTSTAFERVQPFSLLGHNGEINTIARLREQAAMLSAQLVDGGSDSQDLNRVLEFLIHHYGFTLLEAIELVFPPILSEIDHLPADLQRLYSYYLQAFGPYAQGPAAIVARYGDECVFSVDALGLRPLWFGETEKEYIFSSEKGVVPLDLLNGDPKPLAPGEKMGLQLLRNTGVTVLDYPAMQQRLRDLAVERCGSLDALGKARACVQSDDQQRTAQNDRVLPIEPTARYLAALGWSHDDARWAQGLAEKGKDPVDSLGYDGPLASLSTHVQNLSDYFKETVAVVTNPAVDREREQEHFSTQAVIGPRPPLKPCEIAQDGCLVLENPVLAGGHARPFLLGADYRQAAASEGAVLLEDVIASFAPERVASLELANASGESVRSAVERLAEQAIQAVKSGAELIVLDDTTAFAQGSGWVDPFLAVARIDATLRASQTANNPSPNYRRRVGLVVRSAAVRNLHDTAMLLGLGADAVAPYLLIEMAVGASTTLSPAAQAARAAMTLRALRIGLEKVASTTGIHALRGYGRIFSSIGLSTALARIMGMPNYVGGAARGLTWANLDADVQARQQILAAEDPTLPRPVHLYQLTSKLFRQLATGEMDSRMAFAEIREVEREHPVALRHIMDFRPAWACERGSSTAVGLLPQNVDTEITGHSLPFVIASMSFGSQSEVAYRAYAEAAYRLNIIALNGEGGEIEDLMGKYPHNRGLQIASGRFGVNIEMLNSSNLLEIKIGQGAKPGEGGHLPGHKVHPKIARTRHVSPGVDLISPSNNHDIYSIEDLAQFIEELKTANPKARVAVKVPVVPGIGVICVGITKAGADIINLTGYDGGTGAARAHSIRHVGLPAEIGLVEAHRALLESDMRRRVELWADGGVRTPDDVVKLMCLGANRVGFGTLAMVAIGCILCRSCHLGGCRRGITSHVESSPQSHTSAASLDFDQAIDRLVTLFETLGQEVRVRAAALGFAHLQDIVGQSDLLQQVSHVDRVDLTGMLTPARKLIPPTVRPVGLAPLRRPRNHLTTVVSNLVMEMVAAGEQHVAFEDDRVTPVDRALGTHLAGALTRYRHRWNWAPGHAGVGGQRETWRSPVGGSQPVPPVNANVEDAYLRFYASSVPGNGLGAFGSEPVHITVEGGAQDGVAKGLSCGQVAVLKGYNHDGVRIDGSVGKGLGYGATGGLIIVQGNADSRACIRLSGADVVIGGELTQPLDDSLGYLGTRANVKGFLCEYMTAGRVLVLGDPGPWICAGMTDGVLYLRLQPEMNLDLAAIQRRVARGATVGLFPVDEGDERNLDELLRAYADALSHHQQPEEARKVLSLLDDWHRTFVKVVPRKSASSDGNAVQF